MFESFDAVRVDQDEPGATDTSDLVAELPSADWRVAAAADREGSPVQVDGDDLRFQEVFGWPHVSFATRIGDGY